MEDFFNAAKEVGLAYLDGHYDYKTAKINARVETLPPQPDPDREPVVQDYGLLAGVPNGAVWFGAAAVAMIVLLAVKK